MIYSLSWASEDFQRITEQCCSGLPGVKNISDDTIIYSKTPEEHLSRLQGLFKRAADLGLKFVFKREDIIFWCNCWQ